MSTTIRKEAANVKSGSNGNAELREETTGATKRFSLTQSQAAKQPIDETTESFRNFIRRFRNSPFTKVSYTHWLRQFIEYSNLPEVKAKTGVDVGENTDLLLFEDPRKIQNHIKHFIDYQYEVKHLSPKTVRGYYDSVKHFYESNEVTLNWPIVKDYVGDIRMYMVR